MKCNWRKNSCFSITVKSIIKRDKEEQKKKNKTQMKTRSLKAHLLCYKVNATMIGQFISLTKNWIKRLPGTLTGVIH